MKNFSKLIFILITSSIYFLQNSYANQIDFYGEQNSSWNINETSVNEYLDSFYKQTGLNTDVIILGKGSDCYLENNFDSCIQKQGNYSSDLLVILSMKSDIKNYGDTRGLINTDYNEIISTIELKNIGDQITPYLKNGDYTGGINSYLEILGKLINSKCLGVGLGNNCKIGELTKEYKNYVAQQAYKKKYNTMMFFFFLILIVVLIVVIYKLIKKSYIKKINNLYKDFIYKRKNIGSYEMFEKDKEKILNELDIVLEAIENKLGDLDKNVFYLKKYYKTNKEKSKNIEDLLQKMQETYGKRPEIKDKVEKVKSINL